MKKRYLRKHKVKTKSEKNDHNGPWFVYLKKIIQFLYIIFESWLKNNPKQKLCQKLIS